MISELKSRPWPCRVLRYKIVMKRRKNESGWTSAQVLSEALPFIQRHSGRWVVIKFGGHAMAPSMSQAVKLSAFQAVTRV